MPVVTGYLLLADQLESAEMDKLSAKLESIIDHLDVNTCWDITTPPGDKQIWLLLDLYQQPRRDNIIKLIWKQLQVIVSHMKQILTRNEMDLIIWEGSITFSLSPEGPRGLICADHPIITFCYYQEGMDIQAFDVDKN